MVLLEFSMSPLGKGESVSKYVARSLDIIDKSGVAYRLNPMGTVLEGEWDEVMAVVKKCYLRMRKDFVIGAGSFLSELVERAGGRNVFGDLAAASAPVSLEAIASREIDVVLVLGDTVPAFARRAEWLSVPAVREHRFVYVPSALFSRPGPRSPEALRVLSAALRAGPPS